MMTAYDSAGTDGGAWLFICQSHMHTLLYISVHLTECPSAGKELSGQNFKQYWQLCYIRTSSRYFKGSVYVYIIYGSVF